MMVVNVCWVYIQCAIPYRSNSHVDLGVFSGCPWLLAWTPVMSLKHAIAGQQICARLTCQADFIDDDDEECGCE